MKESVEGYCMKCKKKITIKNAKVEVKNNKRMAMGVCNICGTKVCRILGKEG